MAFTEDEVAYLKSQPLGRLATVDADGQPDVVPVGFEFDGTYLYIGGRAPDPDVLYPTVEDGVKGVAFIEATVRSSKRNAAWVTF